MNTILSTVSDLTEMGLAIPDFRTLDDIPLPCPVSGEASHRGLVVGEYEDSRKMVEKKQRAVRAVIKEHQHRYDEVAEWHMHRRALAREKRKRLDAPECFTASLNKMAKDENPTAAEVRPPGALR